MTARTIALPISSFLPNLGGAEVGLHNIAGKLVDRGHRPVVMAPAPHAVRLVHEGWRLPYPVEAMPPKAWSLLRRAPWLGFWLLDRFFSAMQSRHGFDVWHCTMGYPTGVALIHFAQRRPDIRYVIRCAGEDIQRDPDIGYGARLDPKVDSLVRSYLPRAQMLTAISDSVADEYRALGVDDAGSGTFRTASTWSASRAMSTAAPYAPATASTPTPSCFSASAAITRRRTTAP